MKAVVLFTSASSRKSSANTYEEDASSILQHNGKRGGTNDDN
jgi:hypothetical protein